MPIYIFLGLEYIILFLFVLLQLIVAFGGDLNESGIYNKFYALHTLHTHTYNIEAHAPAHQFKVTPGTYTSLLPSSTAAHQLGEFSYVTLPSSDNIVINAESCKQTRMESSSGCMRMKSNEMVQYFNDDGFSMLTNVSPGVYLITLLAIASWQILSTVMNSSRPANDLRGKPEQNAYAMWRQVVKRSVQFVIVICWIVTLIKYSSISGLYAETWENYDKNQGGLLYEMVVSLYQSTNLASTLVCVVAFLLCVWWNVGDSTRWSKMTWVLKESAMMSDYMPAPQHEMLPIQTLSMNSMFATQVKPPQTLETGVSASLSVKFPSTSTNDSIVFYAFVLFFAFTQLIASRSSVCLETHLQCFIGVTLIFIVVELAYSKMSEFLWELEAEAENVNTRVLLSQTNAKFVERAKEELMHVHYVAWVIRLFVCIFEIILFLVAQEVFLADGDGFNGYFHAFFILGMIYVALNLLVAVMQALGLLFSASGQCTDRFGGFIPMLWQKQDTGRTQRRQLRSWAIMSTPVFYTCVIIITLFFCWDQVFGGAFGSNSVTANERQLYASLTQQYLKANNYIDQTLKYEETCRNSVPIERDPSVDECQSKGICGANYLLNTTQMMLIQPAKNANFRDRLDTANFKYNTWTKFIDPFHLKIGFWTKFFEIKKIDFVKNEQTKWTASGTDKYGVLCHNFFALHEGVDCKAAAQYQRVKMM